MLSGWAIWISWRAHSDWTIDDGARRLVASLRLLHEAFGEFTPRFKLDARSFGVDDPDAAEVVAGELTLSRNGRLFSGDALGDAGVLAFPVGQGGFHVNFQQVFTAGGGHEAWFRVEFDESRKALLDRHSGRLPGLIARLGALWQADSGWLDFVHVRQEWNDWDGFTPVFSWVTWLSSRYDEVDLGGADAEVTVRAEGGRIVMPRVGLAEVADPDNERARRVIEDLASRLG